MMALHHRKLLGLDKPDKDDEIKSGSHRQISNVLIAFLCIFGATFLLVSYLAIRRFRSRRRTPPPPPPPPPEIDMLREDIVDELHGPVIDNPIWYIRTVGLPQSVIDSIEVFKYRTGEGLIESSDCSVCLSEFQEDESLRLLPKCSHAFHVACIDMWLSSHKNCPVCRAPVIKAGDNDASSSSPESMVEIEEESDLEVIEAQEMGMGDNRRVRVMSDLGDQRAKIDREMEVVRRSVSVDSSSAFSIHQAVADVHVNEDGMLR